MLTPHAQPAPLNEVAVHMHASPTAQQIPTTPVPGPPTQPPHVNVTTPGHDSTLRLKAACSHCRAQKVKCIPNVADMSQKCERCAKMGRMCFFEPRMGRGRGRSVEEGIGEREREREGKRRVLDVGDREDGNGRVFVPVNHGYSGVRNWRDGVAVENEEGRMIGAESEARNLNGVATVVRDQISPTVMANLNHIAAPTEPRSTLMATTLRNGSYSSPHLTVARTLDGLTLEADTIDNLFAQYFRCYHPFLPILDSMLRPNEYHTQSSFLFWSILTVASRRWTKDRALMSAMRRIVLTHATTSIFSPNAGTSTITAVLLLLTWSFPEMQNQDEMPYVLSSALVHAAIRVGMNIPLKTPDFSRVKISISSAEAQKRYRIWCYCLLLYQQSACCMGNTLGRILTQFSDENGRNLAVLSPQLNFQMEMQRCVGSIGNSNEDRDASKAALDAEFIDHTLRQYANNLQNYKFALKEPLPPLENLYLSISGLMLEVFNFHRKPISEHLESLHPAFDAAISLIHQLNDLEKLLHVDLYGTSYISYSVTLSACVLLRCLKTPFVDLVPEQASTAQALFFSAINMLRNISLQPHHVQLADGDKPMKSSVVLQTLWRSETVFRHEDGSWDMDLRVRDRFGSSVVYDVMQWGREELARQEGAYPKTTAPPPTANGESMFRPDVLSDRAFPQDWIVNDWEVDQNGAGSSAMPAETMAGLPREF